MGLWTRLKQRLSPPKPGASGTETGAGPDALPSMPPEEAYLRQLLARLEGMRGAAAGGDPAGTALPSLGGHEFWSAVERLVLEGRERTARELLGRLAALRPGDHELAARLAEMLCDALDFAAARPLLERLCRTPEHAPRAHFLLGEIHERGGELDLAREHYEAVLGLDIDHPNARLRADRLRARRPEPAPALAAAAPTLLGLEAAAHPGVGERYRLVRELGRGMTGAVYLARDVELERDVALKLLHPRSAAQQRLEARARSFNEARVAAALRHPGVVAIYDIDEEAHLIAMELCHGGTLRDRLQRGPLPPREALGRALELTTTLAAVHRAGVVHLDLKPGNLLFRARALASAAPGEGDLVLGDFGLAHLEQGAAPHAEEAGGTLLYMAPERRLGEVTPAVDLYAVGVILHEMLAGAIHADPAALLRGEHPLAQAAAPLSDTVSQLLGPALAPVRELLAALTAAEAAARPSAAQARDRLVPLVARLG